MLLFPYSICTKPLSSRVSWIFLFVFEGKPNRSIALVNSSSKTLWFALPLDTASTFWLESISFFIFKASKLAIRKGSRDVTRLSRRLFHRRLYVAVRKPQTNGLGVELSAMPPTCLPWNRINKILSLFMITIILICSRSQNNEQENRMTIVPCLRAVSQCMRRRGLQGSAIIVSIDPEIFVV